MTNCIRRPMRAVLLLGALLLGPVAARAAEPYEVHAILPLTGPGAFLGTFEQQSMQIAAKMINAEGGINGRPLAFVFHDDQTSPQVAVQLTGRILADHPSVLFGSTLVAMCNAEAPLVAHGPLTYCFSPGIYPKPGSFMFTSSVATRALAAAQVRYFRLRGWTRIALITSTDASGQDAERAVQEAMARPENKDLRLVESAHFNPTDVSVSAQIERIRQGEPQALIAWSTGASIGTVFKAIVGAGLDVPVATTNGNMLFAQMDQYAAFLPKQLYIPATEWPENPGNTSISKDVEAAKQRMFGAFRAEKLEPDAAATFAWDPVMLMVHAWRALGLNASAEDLRNYLSNVTGFAGVNGIYDFRKEPQRGLDESDVVVTRWTPDAHRWVVTSGPGGTPLQK